MSEPVLQVKGLKTYYYTEEGVVPAVDGLDFEVEPGETFAIVGESGCGKSVTSLSILRLIPSPPGKIIDGEIIYHGQDLVKKSEREMRSIRGNDISMIFQELVERLFNIPGMGSLMVDSIEKRDYQVIQAITLLIAMLNVFINLIIDLIYGLADPRIRLD